MRCLNLVRSLLIAGLLVGVCASGAYAQKNKGGGGGNTDPPSPPPRPNVSYEVTVLPVEGLGYFEAVNDWGQCVVTLQVSEVSTIIDTEQDLTAAVVDTQVSPPVVRYLDNLIDTEENWDLVHAVDINNRGQVVCLGYKDGLEQRRSCLLTPRNDGTLAYDLTELGSAGTESLVVDLSESGDVLYSSDGGQKVRMNDGTLISLPSSDQYYYSHVSSLGLVLGQQYYGGILSTLPPPDIYNFFSGEVTQLELLPYMTGARVEEFAESGYSFGKQAGPILKIKGQSVGGFNGSVTYDPLGNATDERLPFNILDNYEINSQVEKGVPLIAGTVGLGESSDIYRKPWIRFPGYDAVVISDLMDDTQKRLLDELNLGSNPGESDLNFMITTPRDASGSVLHDGAPTLYGLAYRFEVSGSVTSSYEGIYVIRPVVAH